MSVLLGSGPDAAAIVAAFGFTREDRVRSITFRMAAGSVATVDVERLLLTSSVPRIASVFERFTLQPVDERHHGEPLGDFINRLISEATTRIHGRIAARSKGIE